MSNAGWARAAMRLVALAVVVACAPDAPVGPRGRTLELVSGQGQHAAPGAPLPSTLTVRLIDASGRPIAGAPVTWVASGGTLSDMTVITDADGNAAVRYTLGDAPGAYAVRATASGARAIRFDVWADDDGGSPLHALTFVTYDGSGQVVHPDVARIPDAWGGGVHRLAITPYPGGNSSFENPSLYAGDGGDAWNVPPGIANPLVRPGSGAYLSDPDIVYDPLANELRLYYREVTGANEVWLIRSSDGRHWSAPQLVARAPNHEIVSPTVVRRGPLDWLMWSVNSGAVGCGASSTTVELRRSTDGLAWSAPQTVSLVQAGGSPWHIDVEWIPSRNEFWALYPAKRPGGCTTAAVYLATSPDGVHWQTHPGPVLARGAIDALADVVYRSTFEYDPATDEVTIWYSGAKYDGTYVWRAALERVARETLFERVAASPAIGTAPTVRGPDLTNETAP